MTCIARVSQSGPKDLIVVSHSLSLYTSNTSADSFHFWLDHVSKSSYMIVKASSSSSSTPDGERERGFEEDAKGEEREDSKLE